MSKIIRAEIIKKRIAAEMLTQFSLLNDGSMEKLAKMFSLNKALKGYPLAKAISEAIAVMPDADVIQLANFAEFEDRFPPAKVEHLAMKEINGQNQVYIIGTV